MASGIVRRIDELGRIVIPKEMRKTMRLHVGDEMEISSNGDVLTLKRYGGFQNVKTMLKSLARTLCKATDADVLIVGANDVELCEGKNKKQYENAHITDTFSRLLRERKDVVLHGDDLCHVFEDRQCSCAFMLINPLVVGGDYVGACLLLLDTLPSDVARAYLEFCVRLIEASLV